MKSVCIVGAGPAGLAGAKVLLGTKHFNVTIFEKADGIGGIWRLDESSNDGYLSPSTPTNLSKFTVSFSDLDWNSVDLSSRTQGEEGKADHKVPIFPKAWHVNR
jgi:cation diffusion facilitator CzcD-associated flavoprotein CzcO